MSCKCATLDPDNGRYECSVSGSGCMYLMPNSKRCAEEYGEGPDAKDESLSDSRHGEDSMTGESW